MTDNSPPSPTTPDLCREPVGRTEWGLLAGLTLLGLLLRLWMRPMVVWPLGDAVHYLNQARYGPWSGTWSPVGEQWWLPPLYPWLISLTLGGSTDPALTLDRGVLVSILAGTLTAPALWWVVRPLLGPTVAFWTALLAAGSAFLVAYSATAITEPLYMLLLVLLWGCGIRWAHGNERMAIVAPLIGVGLFLTRAFGLVQFPLLFLGVWWTKRALQSCDRCFVKQSMSAWAIFLVASGLTIGKTSLELGEFAIDGKSRYQFIRLGAPDLTTETPDPNYEGIMTPDGMAYAPATPWFTPLEGKSLALGQVRKYLLRQRRIWWQWITGPVPPYTLNFFDPFTLMLAGAGLVLLRRGTLPASWRLWPALLAAPALVQPVTFVEPRYFVSLLPLAMPLAAVGLTSLVRWMTEQSRDLLEPRMTQGLAASAVLGAGLLILAPYANWTRGPDVQYNPPLEMSKVLQTELGTSLPGRIFDTPGNTAYYLGIEGWVIPDVGPDQLIAFARRHGIGALVMDERMARGKHNRQLLQFLYDIPDDYPQYGLRLLGWRNLPEGRSWRVYAIEDPLRGS